MKRYSSLIRKLVDATAEAEVSGTDVATILKGRCFNETSIVRQTLMNAVCDPRFKIDADVVGYWKDEARNALEQLADALEKTQPLTEDTAYYMLDDFLNAWLRMSFGEIKKLERKKTSYFEEPKDNDEKNVSDALDYLNNLEDLLNPSYNEVTTDDENDSMSNKEASSDNGEVSSEQSGQEGTEPENKYQENKQQNNITSRSNNGRGVGKANSANIQRLEERFLQKIPQSLIELARRIGRMGENGYKKEGKFSSAGKSDITGITVGSDISAVLPSELALLAEKQTQDVFYHKYTSRRLQLFASASQSNSSKKHQDGPVIVCVDTSSSMNGEPVMVAKTLAITIAIIAWRQKRDVIMVKYSDNYDYLNLGHNRSRLGELLQFLSIVTSGGNNENDMFAWLFRDIKPSLPDYETADILCVSDFGWMPIMEGTEKIINKEKDQGMRFYGLNIGAGNPLYGTNINNFMSPMEVCDSVWTYENGECKEMNDKSNNIYV